MNFRSQAEDERLRKFMMIAPGKKLEWLYQMNEFIRRFSSKKQRRLRLKLRKAAY